MVDSPDDRLEFTGKTVEEALAAAAAGFGVAADQLEVEVLAQPGSLSALFGRKARILARPKNGARVDPRIDELKFSLDAPRPAAVAARQAPAAMAGEAFDPVAALTRLAGAIEPGAQIEARETEDNLVLDIKADGSGIFIGRKGATLEAIQLLMTLMSQKQAWRGKRLLVDSERYRERRIEALRDACRGLAERARTTGQIQRTEPLDAPMRKVVHSEIKIYPGLTTKSIGDGEFKRVQIVPENAKPRESGGRDRDRGPREGRPPQRRGGRSRERRR